MIDFKLKLWGLLLTTLNLFFKVSYLFLAIGVIEYIINLMDYSFFSNSFNVESFISCSFIVFLIESFEYNYKRITNLENKKAN